MAEQKMLKVTQIRSGIGYNRRQTRVLRSMGLGRMNRTVTLPDNDAVRGMIRAVPHLVKVEEGFAAKSREDGHETA